MTTVRTTAAGHVVRWLALLLALGLHGIAFNGSLEAQVIDTNQFINGPFPLPDVAAPIRPIDPAQWQYVALPVRWEQVVRTKADSRVTRISVSAREKVGATSVYRLILDDASSTLVPIENEIPE